MKKILILLITIYSFAFSNSEIISTLQIGNCRSEISSVGNTSGTAGVSYYKYTRNIYFKTIKTATNSPEEYPNLSFVTETKIKYTCTFNSSDEKTDMCFGVPDFNSDGEKMHCDNETGDVIPLPIGVDDLDSNGNYICSPNYSDLGGTCTQNKDNSDGYNEDGKPNCNTGFMNSDNECIDDPTRKDDGTCEDGFHVELNNPQCVADSTPPDDSNNGGSTGGGTSGGGSSSGGSDDNSSGGSSGGGSSGGSGNDGDTVSGETGTGGSGSGGTPDPEPSDSYVPEPPSENTGFICSDNGPSLETSDKFHTCDRTCEQVDMVTDPNTGMCVSNKTCKDDETQTGTDLQGDPICWKTSPNDENGTIEGLLADIKDNTKLNKNSNTQLGNLNNKVNSTNAKLEALKGGISQSNSLLDNINTGVTAITDFLKTVTDLLSEPSKIGDKISAKLSEVSNKYTQKFVNDTCQPIQTISIDYHGQNVTFLSQELIDKYFPINIMKTMIILTFAMSGALSFFRGAN